MEPHDVEAMLEECGALLKGRFLLSSGKHSDRYVQCAQLLKHPAKAGLVGAAIGAMWQDADIDVVVAPAMGGVIIGHEIARYLGTPFLFTERDGKQMTLRRGFEFTEGSRALVAEDVVTTGKSLLEVARLLDEAKVEVIGAGAIVDRMQHEPFPFELKTLCQVKASVWDPSDSPFSADEVVKPGSRPQ